MHWALLVAAGEEGSLEEFAELDDAASSRGGAAQPRHVCPLCVCVCLFISHGCHACSSGGGCSREQAACFRRRAWTVIKALAGTSQQKHVPSTRH